jgi:hypothetical protein
MFVFLIRFIKRRVPRIPPRSPPFLVQGRIHGSLFLVGLGPGRTLGQTKALNHHKQKTRDKADGGGYPWGILGSLRRVSYWLPKDLLRVS